MGSENSLKRYWHIVSEAQTRCNCWCRWWLRQQAAWVYQLVPKWILPSHHTFWVLYFLFRSPSAFSCIERRGNPKRLDVHKMSTRDKEFTQRKVEKKCIYIYISHQYTYWCVLVWWAVTEAITRHCTCWRVCKRVSISSTFLNKYINYLKINIYESPTECL